jgi:hypothetical protein
MNNIFQFVGNFIKNLELSIITGEVGEYYSSSLEWERIKNIISFPNLKNTANFWQYGFSNTIQKKID